MLLLASAEPVPSSEQPSGTFAGLDSHYGPARKNAQFG
jgi:hypothetical protein